MKLTFKKIFTGEYQDTTNTYKIVKNDITNQWSLYVKVNGVWEWSVEDDAKKYLVEKANEINSENKKENENKMIELNEREVNIVIDALREESRNVEIKSISEELNALLEQIAYQANYQKGRKL